MDPELQKQVKILVKIAIIVLVLLGLYMVVTYLFPYFGAVVGKLPSLLLPFIIALVMAIMIEPIVVFFETKLHLKRNIAVIISLLLFLGLIFMILSLLVSKLSNELAKLSPLIATYSTDIGKIIMDGFSDLRIQYLEMELPQEFQHTISSNWESLMSIVANMLNNAVTITFNLLTRLPSLMVIIIIAMIATFFMLKDRAVIKHFILSYLPGNTRRRSNHVFQELIHSLFGFVKAYSILVTITAIVTMIALKIMRVEYAFTVGLLTGILDLLPIVGPGLLFIPWAVWEMFLGSKALGIGLLVVYAIISVVRQILEPKITGDNIGLHPLATLLSMYIGLKMIGFIGVIVGPILLVLLLAVNRAGFFDGIKSKWSNR